MLSPNDLASRIIPPIGRLRAQRDALAAEVNELSAQLHEAKQWGGVPWLYPPGHYYSPIPDLDEVRRRESTIFATPTAISGIDLRVDEQLEFASTLQEAWEQWPYYRGSPPGARYSLQNDYFGHVDSLVLFGLLCSLRPKRYVEVGSGWSSALALDTRDHFLGTLEATFIEPYPDRLNSLLRAADSTEVTVVESQVQDVDLSTFEQLEPGDFLFIDSTHVSKIGSDVNHLYFNVLPRVAPGVWIHIHDIRYPFEYWPEWIYEGRAWNEAYLLRALLTENPAWRIELWASSLEALRRDRFRAMLPEQAALDGGSIWLRRQ